jgi:hypothetical protein
MKVLFLESRLAIWRHARSADSVLHVRHA